MKKSWIVCLTALLFCLLLASCGETPHTHTPVTVKENEVAATCAAEGSYDEVVKCAECDGEISRTAKTVAKIAHTPVTDIGKDPTVLEDGLTEGSHCDVCGETLVAQTVIPATGGKTAAVSKDMTVTADGFTHTVGNAVETFSFFADIAVPMGASYVVARDEYCEQVIHTKTAPLSAGDNVFYLLVTNGNDMKLYTVTIRRLPLYTVSFDLQNGETVPAQTVEEGSLATAPADPSRAGYTFGGWDYDFTKAPTQSLTVTAQWVAHTDTKYTVEYYLEKLGGGYDLAETFRLTGTTDTVATAEKKTFEHFTWNESDSIMSGNIDADGSRVLKVYYTRNTYTVSVVGDGTVTGAGTYPYGTEVTLTASACLGYTFGGWYQGETLLSDETTLTIPSLEADITARCEVAEDMKPFVFTSTATTCVITDLKDTSIKNVVIPSCVTSIDSDAFSGCTSLESITIPDSVTSIGAYAFSECTSLESITIPDGVTSIGAGVFYRCTLLESITIPDSVTSIGYRAFYYCTTLKSVQFAEDSMLESIGNNAFYRCTLLESITIPDSVTSIGNDAFSGCTSLKIVQFAEDSMLESIGSRAFSGCTSLESITIPYSVTSIGNHAFSGCTSLESVTFENPDGWIADDSRFLSASALTNKATAATYLKKTYCSYTWRRE